MTKSIQPSTPTFKDLIEGDFIYVDKTRYIYDLVKKSKAIYFLSRPRRFGKSLLVSTLEEIFSGNKELFEGLWIHESDYEWDKYPVIRLDFSAHPASNAEELQDVIKRYLKRVARIHGIQLEDGSYSAQFDDLIFELAQKNPQHKKVVLLIDEYDKPLIDHLDNIEEAAKVQKVLKGFYSILKAMDPYLRFVFITGVSKFARISIFSELNHLTELTMQNSFGTALGLTEAEIRHYLADHITAFAQQEGMTNDELMEKIRYWYNGFRFAADTENVYNPFSTMQLFAAKQFDYYWFKSGTPTFLINLIEKNSYEIRQLDNLVINGMAIDSYDIRRLQLIPLLFQTGYLTIKDYNEATMQYTLGYPNHEVESAFLGQILDKFSSLEQGFSHSYMWQLIQALEEHDVDTFCKILQVLFANIEYALHIKYETYYQTIFYLTFTLMGLYIDAEVMTNDGRIDAVIQLENHIYLFEFKIDKSAKKALKQIKDKKYYQKYLLESKPITLVGVNFSTKARNIDDWKFEKK